MIVIDTNIWVSYILASRSSLGQQVKQLIQEQPYALSNGTFVELTDVLMRSKFDRFVSVEKRGTALQLIARGAEWFRPTETIETCRDSEDNKFLELAVASSATLLITGDQDLLTLNPYRGIKIQKITDVIN